MNSARLLLDTVYIQALLNHNDQYHGVARQLLTHVRATAEVWVTEAVLLEVGNALSMIDRVAADAFIRTCYTTINVRVVPVETSLLMDGLDLYQARMDKTWSLTDCISFVVMHQQQLQDAVTADHHFRQAGFRALMLD